MRRVLVAVVVAIVALTTITADADAARPRKRARFTGDGLTLRMGACVIYDCPRDSQSWASWSIKVMAPCHGTGGPTTELIRTFSGKWGFVDEFGEATTEVSELHISRTGKINRRIDVLFDDDEVATSRTYYSGIIRGRFTSSVRAVGKYSLTMTVDQPEDADHETAYSYTCRVLNVPFTLRLKR